MTSLDRSRAGEVVEQRRERVDGVDRHVGQQGGFRRVDRGHVGGADAAIAREGDHRQDALRVPHGAVEREFAEEYACADVGQRLPGGDHDADGDRQIVRRAFFADVGRRQVDDDAAVREREAGVLDRRLDAVLGFFDRRVRQADHREAVEAAA